MCWRLKHSKTYPIKSPHFEKTFLVDGDRNTISSGFSISIFVHMLRYKDDWDLLNTPLFVDPESGKKITIPSSRKYLAEKEKRAGLSPQHINGHSLIVGVATAYSNSPQDVSITAGFLCVWASGA